LSKKLKNLTYFFDERYHGSEGLLYDETSFFPLGEKSTEVKLMISAR
jgi:hypothetical protein